MSEGISSGFRCTSRICQRGGKKPQHSHRVPHAFALLIVVCSNAACALRLYTMQSFCCPHCCLPAEQHNSYVRRGFQPREGSRGT
jgi:hypothetical protein